MNEYYEFIEILIKKISDAKNYADLQKIKEECDISILSEHCTRIDNVILFKNFLSKLLIKKEQEILSSSNKIDVSMTKLCQRNRINQKRMPILRLNYPNISRNLGSIPGIMLSQYNHEERAFVAKEIFDIFTKYSTLLNLGTKNQCIEDHTKNILKLFENELAEKIKMDVNVSFVGNGFNGSGYKITIQRRSFFYKVFYPFKYQKERNHGRNVEAQYAAYASKNCPSYFARFFFGRVAGMYDYDTFIVTEYLAQDKPIKSRYFDNNLLYLYIHDTEKNNNVINNKIVDFGGLYESVPELNDKVVRRLFRIIRNYINYDYDEKTYTSTWKISQKQAKILKDYYSKLELKQEYYNAVDILNKQIHNFPKKLHAFLYNIDNWSSTEKFLIKESCDFKYSISKNLDDVCKLFRYYNVPLHTKSDPVEGYSETGYTIFRLNEEKIFYCAYDKQNEIKEIKFLERDGDIYKPIITIEDIINFDNFNEIEKFVKQND